MKILFTICMLISIASLAHVEERIKRHPDNVRRLQYENDGFACCARCGLPITHCKSRMVEFGRGAAWTLCTYCWPRTTLDEKITYYKHWYYTNKYKFERDGYKYDYDMREMIDAVTKAHYRPETPQQPQSESKPH